MKRRPTLVRRSLLPQTALRRPVRRLFVEWLEDRRVLTDFTWIGTGGNALWNNDNNWTPTGHPNSISDTATFPDTAFTAVSVNVPITISGLSFTNNAAPYNVSAAGTNLTIQGSAGGGTIQQLGNTSNTLANGVVLTGATDILVGAGTLVINATAAGDEISGTGPINKLGAGTLQLGGNVANTFALGVNVNAGLLLANNTVSSTGGGNVSVLNTARLGGTGAVTGPVSVAGNGSIAPGAVTGPGQLRTGSATWTASTTSLSVDLNGPTAGTQYDQLVVTGAVSLGDAVLNVGLGFTPAFGDEFTIIDNDGVDAVVGNFNGLPEGTVFTVGAATFQITYEGGDGNDVVLTAINPANPILRGTPGADNFSLMRNAANLELRRGATLIYTAALAAVNTLTINGLAGDDVLTVTYNAAPPASPIPAGGLTFHGGLNPGDDLVITGGTFTTITNNYANTNNGNVVLTAAQTDTITYTGLAPINMAGSTATNLVFNLPPAASNAILEQPAANLRLRSANGTFETTTFANPGAAGSVTINRGNTNDTLTINAVPALTAGLRVGSGNAFNAITVAAPVTPALLDLTATAINLNANVTATGDVDFRSPVLVGANVTVQGANVRFAATVNDDGNGGTPSDVAINTTGNGQTVFTGAVGGGAAATALTSLSTNADGTTQINGGSVRTTGTQTYGDAVTLGQNTALFGTTATFQSTLAGNNNSLDVNANAVFGNAAADTVTGLTTLSVLGNAATTINTNTVTTTGQQNYTGPVTIGATAGTATLTTTNNPVQFGAVTLQSNLTVSTGNGNVTFNGTVDGASALQVNTTGTTTFNAAVGVGAALASLTTNALGTTQINGGAVRTSGTQTYGDAVTIGTQDATLTSTGDADISFNSTVDSAAAQTRGLTVNTAGTTTFNSTVGAGQALATLTTNANGRTHLNGNVTTTGTQTYNDAVTLLNNVILEAGTANITLASTVDGASNLELRTTGTGTFGGAVGGATALNNLTTNAGGATRINGGSIRTTGTQTYGDAVTIDVQDATLTSTGDQAIVFNNTVNGPRGLTGITGGTTTFNGAVGTGTPLLHLTTSLVGTTVINTATVTTADAQTYDNVEITSALATLTSNNDQAISFNGTVNGPGGLTVTTGGTTTFSGPVGGTTLLASLTVNDGGTTRINGGLVRTTGAQNYTDAVTVGIDATLSGTTITFAALDGPGGLTINATTSVAFNGTVGPALAGLDVTGTTTINTATVTTTGPQTYNSPVTIAVTTTLASSGDAAISFLATVNGPGGLTVNTAGTARFGDAAADVVGGTTPLASLTTNLGGTTQINANITTAGTQTYGDAVAIGGPTIVLTSNGGAANGAIRFDRPVDGPGGLTVTTAGTTTFAGIVGPTLANLTTNGTGTTQINGGSITTAGAQTYDDAVTIGTADATLASSSNAAIVFNSTVDSAAGPARGLTVVTSGTTTFGGIVGGLAELANLTTNAGGTTQINGGGAVTVRTAGTQTYGDAVTIGNADATLSSTGNLAISFNNTVDSAGVPHRGLTINTTGTTTFAGAVGVGTPLANLTTNAGGTTRVTGGQVVTSGNQTFRDAVIVAQATTHLTSFRVQNFLLEATGSLNGIVIAESAEIIATGNVTFNGPEGDTQPLNVLRLQAGGAGTQTAALRGNGLQLLGTGTFTLDHGSNDFSTLAALVGGNLRYRDATALIIGVVPPAGGTSGVTSNTGLVEITTGGALTVAANVIASGPVLLDALESAAVGNDVVVISSARVRSQTADVTIEAGDNISLAQGSQVEASAAGAKIVLQSQDDATDAGGSTLDALGSLNAATIEIRGSADNDIFRVHFGRVIGVVEVYGNGSAPTLASEGVRDGRDTSPAVDPNVRPFFVPELDTFRIGDQLFADDSLTQVADAAYVIDPQQSSRNGAVFLRYPQSDLAQMSLITTVGNNDVTAQLGPVAGPHLPTIVQVDTIADAIDAANPSAVNRFQVEGSADADNISIGDIVRINPHLPLGRAHFELEGFTRLWVRGNGGDDVIDNISSVPGVLDGGAGGDSINSIVNFPNSGVSINNGNISGSLLQNVTLVLGGGAADNLFVGSGAIPGTTAIQQALAAFPDLGITFLLGDHEAGAAGTALTEVVADGDRYSSSSAEAKHGYISRGDDPASRGLFKFAGGDQIRFSSTIAWLKAQIFVEGAVNDLVAALANQLRFYTNPIPITNRTLPPLPPLGPIVSPPSAALDVNHDGELSPIDALLIINDLNSFGSRAVPAPGGEGELTSVPPLASLDVDGDGHIAPKDALAVINALNALARLSAGSGGEGEGAAEDDAAEALVAADAAQGDLVALLAEDVATASRRRR